MTECVFFQLLHSYHTGSGSAVEKETLSTCKYVPNNILSVAKRVLISN
jgi:hypothetical protein